MGIQFFPDGSHEPGVCPRHTPNRQLPLPLRRTASHDDVALTGYRRCLQSFEGCSDLAYCSKVHDVSDDNTVPCMRLNSDFRNQLFGMKTKVGGGAAHHVGLERKGCIRLQRKVDERLPEGLGGYAESSDQTA